MQIKNIYKTLYKTIIIISVIECLYLFALPPIANIFLNKDYIKNIVKTNTNAELSYTKAKLKTHILPYLTFKVKDLKLSEQNLKNEFINAKDLNVKISIFPLLNKKINLKQISSSDINIDINRDTDGTYNFEKLFKNDKESVFKICYENIKININNYEIKLTDNKLNKTALIQGTPLIVKNKLKKNYIKLVTQGNLINNENLQSTYDIDLKAKYPVNFKKIDKKDISGQIILYDIDLNTLFPLIQKFTQDKITKLSGHIDYVQLSANENKIEKSNHITLNTRFKDLVFDKADWKNYIQANGENNIGASIELYDNTIQVNKFSYKAENININSNGSVILGKNPVLDIGIEVKESRAENIASILPPNLVPQYMTIEKIKTYGVYGDLDAKVSIKGQIPKPDITGWVKGRDVHILDKSIHKLHKGTVDINFNKNILNMDILVEMFNNQKAKIQGYTYMYRDGINDVTIKTTNNIDFPLAQKIIIPISKVFNFLLGPIPDMNITSGKGIIDMRIRGSIDFIDMNGYCKFDKANLTYNGLFANIMNGKGKLDFTGDIISFKSDKIFVKNNFVEVDGKVKINDNLDFNISSNKVEAKDLLELINKSELLKDVKAGLAVITSASGPLKLGMNIKAKIVPVPWGQPPLPPEEAFKDMRVKGKVNLSNNTATIIGFETPLYDLIGNVDFTETVTTINNIDAKCLKSPINIKGKVINDLKTKVPFVDMAITSNAVYLGDTIKFLTRSYLYPDYYPDLSVLYNLNSQHDLYFTYKAKSVDFLTNKAYAEMNFIKDNSDNPLKAKDGKIIMKNANVYVENVNADLLGSNLNIKGNVKRVDTLNPIYNLDINTEKFDLKNLDNTEKYNILPEQAKTAFKQLKDYRGLADINVALKNNIINGKIDLFKPQFNHSTTNIPFIFDDFTININNDKVNIDNVSASIGDMPFYGNFKISNIYKIPNIDSYFTTKLTNNFVKKYLPKEISDKLTLKGDINLSSDLTGNQNDFNITPKLTFYPDSDVIIDGISFGETTDTREFDGNINITPNKINVKKLDYIKYITSQNNISYPVLFATGGGILKTDKEKNLYEPEEIRIKTEKSLSAKLLNVFLKQPIFKQGSLNCDLKYIKDTNNNHAKITGNMDSRNLDIPLFDTVIKNIKLDADDNNIAVNIFGFLNDSRFKLTSDIDNNIISTPKIQSLTIDADQIDNDKLLRSLSKARKAMTTNNSIKNTDFTGINIENGLINIKKLIVKSLIAENVKSKFSINEQGIFNADDINVDVGQGNIAGKINYDLNNSEFKGDFELTNVDSNYVTETLFDGKNQIYGNANGKIVISTKGTTDEEIVKNLSGVIFFEITDGNMPKLGSLEYLLRAGNIIKNGITGLTINSILQLLNLVKTGYFSNINGSCIIENGIAKDIEIYSTGENMSLYIHGEYDISKTSANMEVLGKLSNRISTIFGAVGNTSLNTFFKLIPGISLFDFGRKDFIEDVEKIPPFTNGDYESRVFQAIINGDINSSGYVQSFKWVKN